MQQPIIAVGIDPAKRVHRAVAVLYPDTVVLDREFRNTASEIEKFDNDLASLAAEHGASLLYGLEDHRRYGKLLAEVLGERAREMRVVNPLWTHRQRAFYGEDKDDFVDGRSVAAVLLRRRDTLPKIGNNDALSQSIREAERMIQSLAEQSTAVGNRLHQLLNDVYTSCYADVFSKMRSFVFLRFFRQFPVPQDLNGHIPEQLAECIIASTNGRLGPASMEQRTARYRQKASELLDATRELRAKPRTLALDLKAELIRQACDQLLANKERRKRLEGMLQAKLLPATGETISSIPGIGTVIAATILGEIGDIHTFRSRDAFAKYNGTAPASNSSGGKQRHKARRSCNHRLKRAFFLAANAAKLYDPLAKAYYEKCQQRGLGYVESLKRVARRMSDIVYAMLRSGKRYDPEHAARAIAERAARNEASEGGGKPAQRQTPLSPSGRKPCRPRPPEP